MPVSKVTDGGAADSNLNALFGPPKIGEPQRISLVPTPVTVEPPPMGFVQLPVTEFKVRLAATAGIAFPTNRDNVASDTAAEAEIADLAKVFMCG